MLFGAPTNDKSKERPKERLIFGVLEIVRTLGKECAR